MDDIQKVFWKARIDSWNKSVETASVTVKKTTRSYYKLTSRAGLIWNCTSKLKRFNYDNTPMEYHITEIAAIERLHECLLTSKKHIEQELVIVEKRLEDKTNG